MAYGAFRVQEILEADNDAYRALEMVVGPKSEPLTLDEAKKHLRIDTTDEDVLTSIRLKAARSACEQHMSRALINQRWKLTLDRFPREMEPLRLYRPPFRALVSLRYMDENQAWQTMDPLTLRTVKDANAAWLVPNDNWPDTYDAIGVVEATWDAGYIDGLAVPQGGGDPQPSDGDPTDAIPFEIKAAILLTLGTLDVFHEDAVSGTIVTQLPRGAEALMSPFRASIL